VGNTWQIVTVDSAPADLLQPVSPEEDREGSQLLVGEADLREWRYFYETQRLHLPQRLKIRNLSEDQVAPLRITEKGVGLYTSIAVDAFSYPSISYYDSINEDLKYARWTGTAWEILTVDEPGDADDGNWGQYSSLVMDSNGYPHISFYSATTKDLTTLPGTGATGLKRLDSTDDVGMYTSIILDSNGKPHISYYDNKNGT